MGGSWLASNHGGNVVLTVNLKIHPSLQQNNPNSIPEIKLNEKSKEM